MTAAATPIRMRARARFSALFRDASPALLGSLLHSVLAACALPGMVPAWIGTLAAFLALLPLVWVVKGRGGLGALFLGVWLGQIPLWVLQQWWVIDVSEFGFFPFVALQASWVAGYVVVTRLAREHVRWLPGPVAAAVVWAGIEFVRGRLFLTGYAWGLAGDALIDWPVLASPARVGGLYLVGFLMMLLVAGAWRLAAGREGGPPHRRTMGAVCVACAAGVWIVCAMVVVTPGADSRGQGVHVAVVQTNVPQSNKIGWTLADEVTDFQRFMRLTKQAAQPDAAGHRPAFIVWPETMMPGITLEPSALEELDRKGVIFRVDPGVLPDGKTELAATAFAGELCAVQRELGIPMLIGEEGIDGLRVESRNTGGLDFKHDKSFNSVYLVDHGAPEPGPMRYDKIHLTPFGEVMPLVSRWDWLEQQLLSVAAGGMKFDLDEGTRRTVFTIPMHATADGSGAGGNESVRAVTPVCFEVTDAALCRSLVFEHGVRRADLFVSVTNDGWFNDSDLARRQHLNAARWRAFEFATPVVRAANTGISAIITADGVIAARGVEGSSPRAEARVDGILRGDVPLGDGRATAYGRLGDWAGWGCFVGLCAIGVCGVLMHWRARRALRGQRGDNQAAV